LRHSGALWPSRVMKITLSGTDAEEAAHFGFLHGGFGQMPSATHPTN
jgi:hypothetical protein